MRAPAGVYVAVIALAFGLATVVTRPRQAERQLCSQTTYELVADEERDLEGIELADAGTTS